HARHRTARVQARKHGISHGVTQVSVTGSFCRQPMVTLRVTARRVRSSPYCPRPQGVPGATVGFNPCHTTATVNWRGIVATVLMTHPRAPTIAPTLVPEADSPAPTSSLLHSHL